MVKFWLASYKKTFIQISQGATPFVTYVNQQDAKKAKEQASGQKIDNYVINVNLKRMPSQFKQSANVFIKNIPKKVTVRQLEALFAPYGNILSSIIKYDSKGESLGYGYVQYEEDLQAQKAVEELNKKQLEGQELIVQSFISSKNRAQTKNNLYIKHFPSEWDKEQINDWIEKAFNKYGNIISQGVFERKMIEERISYFAFVALETDQKALEAAQDLNKIFLTENHKKETPLYVTLSLPKNIRFSSQYFNIRDNNVIIVRSLLPDVTEKQLVGLFSQYGQILSLSLKDQQVNYQKEDPTKLENVKHAMITFSTQEQAQKAFLEGKKNKEILKFLHPKHNSKKNEFIFFFQPKQIRKQYLAISKNTKRLLQLQKAQQYAQNPYQPLWQAPLQKQGKYLQAPLNQVLNQGGIISQFPQYPQQAHGQQMSQGPMVYVGNQQVIDLTGQLAQMQLNNQNEFSMDWIKNNKLEFTQKPMTDQKEILGTLMFKRIEQSALAKNEDLPKITGMLIDLEILDLEEILDILENDQALHDRVIEAYSIFQEEEQQKMKQEKEKEKMIQQQQQSDQQGEKKGKRKRSKRQKKENKGKQKEEDIQEKEFEEDKEEQEDGEEGEYQKKTVNKSNKN